MQPDPAPSHSHSDLCPSWLSALIDNPLRRLLHPAGRLFAGLVRPGMTVLDLGCGPGTFTLDLARLVGPEGRVVAVDLQPAMLERVARRAGQAGLRERIRLHNCSAYSLDFLEPVLADFALAFWMVHEVPDPERFLGEALEQVRPGGKLLLVEPVLHVGAARFAQETALAEARGWRRVGAPAVRISRAALFKKS